MKKQFHTPSGIIEKVLTVKELNDFADSGDIEAKREIAKISPKITIEDRIKRIEKYLEFI